MSDAEPGDGAAISTAAVSQNGEGLDAEGRNVDDASEWEVAAAGSSQGVAPSESMVDDDRAEERPSPSVLGEYLGYEIPGLDGRDEMELRRIEQDAIAECMSAQGFDYIAWVENPAEIYLPVEDGLDPASRAFAAKYGFGVSTQFYAQRDVGPGLVGHSGDGSGVVFTENPNRVIADGLSPEERLAYDKAFFGADSPLFGGGPQRSDDGTLPAQAFAYHGCLGEGQRAIDGEAGPVLIELGAEILGLAQRVYADEEYAEYATSVDRCVHEAGFDFYNQAEFVSTLAFFDSLVFDIDRQVGGNPFDELGEEQLASMSAQEIDALYDAPRDIPDAAMILLGEVQALESEVATTAWDCGGSVVQERLIFDRILTRLQAEFINGNRDRLEPFRR